MWKLILQPFLLEVCIFLGSYVMSIEEGFRMVWECMLPQSSHINVKWKEWQIRGNHSCKDSLFINVDLATCLVYYALSSLTHLLVPENILWLQDLKGIRNMDKQWIMKRFFLASVILYNSYSALIFNMLGWVPKMINVCLKHDFDTVQIKRN